MHTQTYIQREIHLYRLQFHPSPRKYTTSKININKCLQNRTQKNANRQIRANKQTQRHTYTLLEIQTYHETNVNKHLHTNTNRSKQTHTTIYLHKQRHTQKVLCHKNQHWKKNKSTSENICTQTSTQIEKGRKQGYIHLFTQNNKYKHTKKQKHRQNLTDIQIDRYRNNHTYLHKQTHTNAHT